MKKLTNGEMFASINILNSLEEKGRLGYAIAHNRRVINEALTEYYDVRNRIITGHGTENGDGTYSLSEEQAAAAQHELDEYTFIEHEVDIMQVDVDTFCSGSLNSQQMFILNWMVKEDSDHERED